MVESRFCYGTWSRGRHFYSAAGDTFGQLLQDAGRPAPVLCVAWAPGGRKLVAGDRGGNTAVIDVRAGARGSRRGGIPNKTS